MGTVGISFGSPTSGAGFDVSSTVAEIVGNLQNVETPWKTQLTTLESQDTTISSLGTLISNLSNDMSTLTDATGILAQKTGSSSDTNVLTLTGATSSAVAGTHTVEVSNLATTSSGYMTQIANAKDTLTGSITLQVGSGTAVAVSVPTSSGNNTLAGLAAAINSSNAGINASVLTDSSGSMLSLVSGTSGAGGNITVSSNSIKDTSNTASTILSYTGTPGASNSGALAAAANTSDTLSGSMTIKVGSGAAQQITMAEVTAGFVTGGAGTNNAPTMAGLVNYINGGAAGVTGGVETDPFGVHAAVNAGGQLTLTSATGNDVTSTQALTVTSSIVDTSNWLGYTSPVTGTDANLTVDGVGLTSASNTVANLIPGVTFQLLAPSAAGEQVQVVIGNDNTDVESTVGQMVSDYNALISAINIQDGNTSSGTPEPLYGSPTLSLLQQQLLGGLNTTNPNGTLTPISTSNNTTLSDSMTISVGGGTAETFVVGTGPSAPNTYYTGSASGYNTLSGLASAINSANVSTALSYTAGSASTGTLTASASGTLSGSITIQAGSGTADTIVTGAGTDTANIFYTGTSVNTLSSLASTINADISLGVTANAVTTDGTTTLTLSSGSNGALTVTPSMNVAGLGVTANVVTSGGQSTLALTSQFAGASGSLSINSGIVATSDTLLKYSDTAGYTGNTEDSGTLSVAAAGDTLTGSISIQAGTGAAQTVNLPPSGGTLSSLMSAINGTAGIGVTASLNSVAVGSHAIGTILTLTSNTEGGNGALTVTSNILDSTHTNSTTLGYTNSSDINSLSSLGISVKNDGSLTFDAGSLDSLLNSDYSSVAGFFQNFNSWGQTFNTMITNAGSSTSTGIISLALKSDSNIESTLNADISKEESMISAQQISLTTELNTANQIMQELPTQLQGVNELYSAITGYGQNQNG